MIIQLFIAEIRAPPPATLANGEVNASLNRKKISYQTCPTAHHRDVSTHTSSLETNYAYFVIENVKIGVLDDLEIIKYFDMYYVQCKILENGISDIHYALKIRFSEFRTHEI